MDKSANHFEFIANAILSVACAFASMRIAIHFGLPAFLSFIPMIFGIAIGIVLAAGISKLVRLCVLGKSKANG